MVRLTPGSTADAVEGLCTARAGGASGNDMIVIRARVRAVPERGKANTALEKLIARWLDIPRSAVSVTSGGKSRLKSLTLDGDPDDIEARLKACCAALD